MYKYLVYVFAFQFWCLQIFTLAKCLSIDVKYLVCVCVCVCVSVRVNINNKEWKEIMAIRKIQMRNENKQQIEVTAKIQTK